MRPYRLIIIVMIVQTSLLQGQDLKPDVYLTINRSHLTTVERGMPLILRVRVGFSTGISKDVLMEELPDSVRKDPEIMALADSLFAPLVLCAPGTAWHQQLIMEVRPSKRGGKSFKTHVLKPRPSGTNLLYPDVYEGVVLGIDPADTRKWKPGTYSIRAGYPLAGTGDTMWSASVSVTMRKKKIKRLDEATTAQLYALGNYYAARGNCRQGDLVLKNIALRDSTSFMFMTLCGDLAACRGDHTEAVKWYSKALMHVPKPDRGHAEEPFLIYLKIQEMTNEKP